MGLQLKNKNELILAPLIQKLERGEVGYEKPYKTQPCCLQTDSMV